MEEMLIYVDGGSRNNGSLNQGYGSMLTQPIDQDWGKTYQFAWPDSTNNEAEYKTLLMALSYMAFYDVPKATIKTDSKLVVEQLAGRWKVKDAKLKPLYEEAKDMLTRIQATLVWVPREEIVAVLGH